MYFDGPSTSESYMEILSRPLADFLEDEVSLRDLSRMCGTSMMVLPHTNLRNHTFDTRILGYGGQQEWPPRSPDLNPPDFFLCGFLKIKVYERESASKSVLLNRISMACRSVTPTMLQKLLVEFLTRVRYCISS
ncbi:UNVERIFIED_CONTAM: hypothetical protein NCL1_25804 [Trichonephila clavipes]